MSSSTMSQKKIQMSLKYNLYKISTYPNAHANAKKWIFDTQYPRNRFEFGIISNDFWSSTEIDSEIDSDSIFIPW